MAKRPKRNPSTVLQGMGKDFVAAGLPNAVVILIRHYQPDMPLEVAGAFVVLGTVGLGVVFRIVQEVYASRGYVTPEESQP